MASNITRYNKNNRGLSLFDDFFDSMFSSMDNWSTRVPAVDVEENDKEYTVKAELPGFDEKDVNLTVENHVLTLSGKVDEKNEEKDKDNRKYLVRERRVETFERSFSLPEGVDEENISAQFKNGLLTVTLPKTAEKASRKLEVKINK